MKRPLTTIRTLLRALGLTLGVLVLLALVASLALRVYGEGRLAKARSALADQGISMDLASYAPPKVPNEENAAAWFQAGAAAIVLSNEDKDFIVASSYRPVREWSDEGAQRARAILAANQGAILNLHRGAALSRSSFDLAYRAGLWAHLPDLRALRKAASLLAVEGRLGLHDGDEGAVVLAEGSLSGLAGTLAREPILIMQIVGESIEARALSLAAEVVAEPRGPHALARMSAIPPSGDRLLDLRRSFGCEAAMMSTMFDPGSALDDSPLSVDTRHNLWLLQASGYARLTHATLLEALLYQRSLVDAPLQTLLVDDPPPPTSPFLMHRWWVHSLTPAARKTALAVRLNLAGRQLVGAAIAIRNTARRDRAYPAALPPEAGSNLPNALTGLPLRYTLDASGSARIEIPGVTAAQLENRYALLALELPPPATTKAGRASR